MRGRMAPLLLWLVFAGWVRANDRPNVVYIVADDHCYRDFGFMGSKDALTPHIDQLAAKSARFVNGYVPSSLCSPSLGVLLTGKYPHQSGLHYNHPPPGNAAFNKMATRADYEAARSAAFALLREQAALPRVMGAKGYTSLQTGKFWEGHFANAGFTEGMTLFTPAPQLSYPGVNRKLADGSLAAHGNGDNGLAIGRETMQPIADFLDRQAQGQPFFVWYAPYLPHQPHDSPPKFYERYEGRGVAEYRTPYLAAVSQFDDTVGQLIHMLEERSLLANTLVVLVSDNGWSPGRERFRNRPAEFAATRNSKYSPFEDGLRTPILLRWDGHIVPATHEELVSSVDLAPTVLEAVGERDAHRELPGRSLLPAAMGTAKLRPRAVFGEIYPGDASVLRDPARDIAYRWVRDGDFKLIVPHPQGGKAAWGDYLGEVALFDVVRDPEEMVNLAADQPEKVLALKQLLDGWWAP